MVRLILITFVKIAGNRNLPRYNQMNINVATWARIIKRTQPNDHPSQHPPLTGTGSSSVSSSSGRPSSVSSSSTRPLPLNLTTSPASTSLPVTAAMTPTQAGPAGGNGSSPPPPQQQQQQQLPSAQTPMSPMSDLPNVGMEQAAASSKPLEAPGEKQHSTGHGIHSAARPLNITLPSPGSVTTISTGTGGVSPMVTSPITPLPGSGIHYPSQHQQPGMIVPIQFPPSGKKPAPPPPPRSSTTVVTINQSTPIQPAGHVSASRSISSPPDSAIEETKVLFSTFFSPLWLVGSLTDLAPAGWFLIPNLVSV